MFPYQRDFRHPCVAGPAPPRVAVPSRPDRSRKTSKPLLRLLEEPPSWVAAARVIREGARGEAAQQSCRFHWTLARRWVLQPNRQDLLGLSCVRAKRVAGAVVPLFRPSLVSVQLVAVPSAAGGSPALVADLCQFSLRAPGLGVAWLREGSVPAPAPYRRRLMDAKARGPQQLHGRYLVQPPRRRRRQRVTNAPRDRDGSV